MANSSITAAQGFEAAGISCGIKQSGHLDLGLIFCPTGGGYDFARLAEHCSRVGLWSLWVHPLGVAIIDWRGRTVVHRKNPLNDDSLAVPATEIDSSGDRRFIVIGEVELRSPILTHPPGSCPGDEYWISSRKLNE